MPGFLFHEIVFGPVRSRRLGLSLGINLLPAGSKYCSFNCIYCECGWTPKQNNSQLDLPERDLIRSLLEKRLQELVAGDYLPDAITYAGNGEPTLHPRFPVIVEDTLVLRDHFVPEAKVSLLSNASMIHKPDIFNALMKLDNNIQKLDAGTEKMFNLINNPVKPTQLSGIVAGLKRFHGEVIIQSMFLRGDYNGVRIDNTKGEELEVWLGHIREIRPRRVMIYSIARPTPLHNLEKVSIFELEKIAEAVRAGNIPADVYH